MEQGCQGLPCEINRHLAAYVRSLAWLAVLAAITFSASNIVAAVLINRVYANPQMTQGAIKVAMVFMLLGGVTSIVGTLLVFTLPQCFQAAVSSGLVRRFGSQGHMGVLLVLPVTAVITWYCYDYLTPASFNFGINWGQDWETYQHGLTAARYLAALAFQAPVTLFSAAYAAAGAGRLPRRGIVLFLALAAAVFAGGIMGHRQAEQRCQFWRGGGPC